MPVKPFGVAKRRLAPILDAAARATVGMAVAAHTALAAAEAGARVVVVTADQGVSRWAIESGWESLEEAAGQGSGLHRAAVAAVAFAAGRPWAIIHADLPIVTAADLRPVFAAGRERVVLAPSRDGGTNVIAAPLGSFPFHYGPGSFRRHAAGAAGTGYPHLVVSRPGLALDLDGPDDLVDALAAPAGTWLRDLVPGTGSVIPSGPDGS